MSLDLTYGKSTLNQIKAWCRQEKKKTWADVDPDLCRHMASLGHVKEHVNVKYNAEWEYLYRMRLYGF